MSAGDENSSTHILSGQMATQRNGEEMHCTKTQDVNENCEEQSPLTYGGKEHSGLHKVSNMLREKYNTVNGDSEKNTENSQPLDDIKALRDTYAAIGTNVQESFYSAENLSEISKHRLSLLRNDPNFQSETSKLLRGILQGSERKSHGNMTNGSSPGNINGGTESSLITKLLQRDREKALSRNGGILDLDESSLRSGTPDNMSDCSDQENLVPRNESMDLTIDQSGGEEDDEMNADFCDNSQDSESLISSVGDTAEAKRARVENIISGMRTSPLKNSDGNGNEETKRHKRKQYTPQQHDVRSLLEEPSPKVRKMDKDVLKTQLKLMQEQLSVMQQKYVELFDHTNGEVSEISENERNLGATETQKDQQQTPERKLSFTEKLNLSVNELSKEAMPSKNSGDFLTKSQRIGDKGAPEDLNSLAKVLKKEIMNSVGTLVDSVVARFVENHKAAVKPPKPARRTPTPPLKKVEQKVKQSMAGLSPVSSGNVMVNSLGMPTLNIPQPKPPRTKVTDKISHSFLENHHRLLSEFARSQSHAPMFPHAAAYYHPQLSSLPLFPAPTPKEPEQTEALSLVLNTPKKKRTKVTDTRLSPRAARALLQEGISHHHHHHSGDSETKSLHHHHHPGHTHQHNTSQDRDHPGFSPTLVPVSLPTSVAIPNPSLQHSDALAMYTHGEFSAFSDPHRPPSHSPSVGDHGSPNMAHTPSEGLHMSLMKSEDFERCMSDSPYDMAHGQTTTLTPMHLRKAKLIFFYCRYPSSAILKIYFPDVKFNKNNTAQLVKWFSNFREFYYIQMEKYSRQALAEGVKNCEELVVTNDSELYRVLNLHYNRNNQIEVPDNFRGVVQATLREFFKSIQAGKDAEQSWKKAIYKVIARMDDPLPEFFKSPNWMEQLNDV